MLKLSAITKDYKVAAGKVQALKGIDLEFRKNEFVCILGPSGCGKTTLLNIIGGLDQYTSGDLVIGGVSTKKFTDRDWDTYRNHSIGFIFQSYHLIPHQTILQNVELALTIAGIDKEERRRRAIEALGKVGLADKIKNLPNQLSGGQMQRVAIARALVNDPEIVLADEPTGALDSKTSVQIMELMKEISRDRLVVMVTHNPDLADTYATRIIRLLDGVVTDDSRPYSSESESAEEGSAENAPAEASEKTPAGEPIETVEGEKPKEAPAPAEKHSKGKKKRSSMSFGMAFNLSLKNLLSKRKRTAMVSVAGSIGIIGVSMVLAVSAGVQNYIASMEDDLLSGYPLTVTETAINFDSLMSAAEDTAQKFNALRLKDRVYVDSLLDTLMSFSGSMETNVITEDYRDYVMAMPKAYYNAIQYDYGFDMSNYIYTDFTQDGTPETTENVSVTGIRAKYRSVLDKVEDYKQYTSVISTVNSFAELPDNPEYILSQYDILATDLEGGKKNLSAEEIESVFRDKESLVLVIDNNQFSDLYFGQYGYLSEQEFLQFAYKAAKDESYNESTIEDIIQNGKGYDFFVGENAKKFTWYSNDSVFSRTTAEDIFNIPYNGMNVPVPGGTDTIPFKYNPTSENFTEEGMDLNVRVILQKKRGISYGCLQPGLYYTRALADYTRETAKTSEIATYLAEKGEPLSMLPLNYEFTYYVREDGVLTPKTGTDTYYLLNLSGGMMSMMGGDGTSMTQVDLNAVAGSDIPIAFYIYPLDFDSKDLVTDYLDNWNAVAESKEEDVFTWTDLDGNLRETTLEEKDKVTYTDTVGLIITMVNTMIRIITIALVVFTALSLVVSTVMVGIITYVSVVERVKEIGILRAVGARKMDIKRLFNAETFIIGLTAGVFGILVTYLLSLIINIILGSLFGVYTIAALPWWQALVMIGISVCLTLISGLIPASAAAKKDPVIALRTE